MESPIEVVRRFCAAWSENKDVAELAEFFADDAVYHNIPLEPVTGKANIAGTIASFIRPGPPGIESIDFRVINIAADGPVVMTERVDVFKLPGKSFELPVMGVFEIRDAKIKAWRDYFDTNQFATRLGQTGLKALFRRTHEADVAGGELVKSWAARAKPRASAPVLGTVIVPSTGQGLTGMATAGVDPRAVAKLRMRRCPCGAAASSPGARSGRCTRRGSAPGSPDALARPPRTARRASPR